MKTLGASRLLFILAFLFLGQSIWAQSDTTSVRPVNNWFNFQVGGKAGKGKWTAELQIRREDWVENWDALMLAGFYHYPLSKNIQLSGVFTFRQTYPGGGIPRPVREYRPWAQLKIKQPLGKGFKLVHRYRYEHQIKEKWAFEGTEWQQNDWNYTPRFRYLLKLAYRLPNSPLGFAAYEEVYIKANNHHAQWHFMRNRLYTGATYELEKFKFQLGYLHQLDYYPQDGRPNTLYPILFFQTVANI